MLKMIHVVDAFHRDAVARVGHDTDAASWSVPAGDGQVVEHAETVTAVPEEAEGLRLILGLAADDDEPVLARLVRLAAGGVSRPWSDGDGWVGLHVLASAEVPTTGGLSVLRPTRQSDESEPEWELTLHLPLKVDRLFVFRRSLACTWSVGQPEHGASLLARAFLVPDSVS